MNTVQHIINYATTMYPRVADISTNDKITILNQLLDEIYNRLLRPRWENDSYDVTTVADKPSYSLPTDATADNILKISISEDDSGSLSSSTNWYDYKVVGLLDDIDISYGEYAVFQDDQVFIFKDGVPFPTDDKVLRMYYYRTPTYLSTVNDVPEIEYKYFNLLKYGLIQNVASIGDNPEPMIADYWQSKYDEEMEIALRSLSDKFNNAPLKTRQVEEYW